MLPEKSLDQRYLEFAAKTSPVFAQFPQIEPLRYYIFKKLLVQRNSIGWKGVVKHWVRPLVRRAGSRCSLNQADLLIFTEILRKSSLTTLENIHHELKLRGINVQFVTLSGSNNVQSSPNHLKLPARALPPAWATDAWSAMCAVEETLHHRELGRSFFYACANIRGFFEEWDRILNKVKPKVILISSTQLPRECSLAVAGRMFGSLTLLLQHGILQPFYTPLLTDLMLTWGESSNEILVKLGVPPEKLVALGSPKHDTMIPSNNGHAKARLLNALSLREKPTFVFFSNGNDLVRNGQSPIECARWLESVATQYSKDANFLVRLHPNEDGSLYRDCQHVYVTKESPDLATTLEACEAVGSLCSTVLYEALLYKKPVWQFYADDWPELADNWRQGLARRVSSQAELSQLIGSLLSGQSHDAINDNAIGRVFANHGRATEAVVDFIESCIRKRPRI